MIAELFLVCALAPRPAAIVHFKGWEGIPTREFLTVYRELKDFMNKFFPGQEFYVMPNRPHAVPRGYIPMALRWRGHTIYRRSS